MVRALGCFQDVVRTFDVVGSVKGAFNIRKALKSATQSSLTLKNSIEGKCVDVRDGYVELHARYSSRFAEDEQAKVMKLPRIIFQSDYAGV